LRMWSFFENFTSGTVGYFVFPDIDLSFNELLIKTVHFE
jgi:hypothetical protein